MTSIKSPSSSALASPQSSTFKPPTERVRVDDGKHPENARYEEVLASDSKPDRIQCWQGLQIFVESGLHLATAHGMPKATNKVEGNQSGHDTITFNAELQEEMKKREEEKRTDQLRVANAAVVRGEVEGKVNPQQIKSRNLTKRSNGGIGNPKKSLVKENGHGNHSMTRDLQILLKKKGSKNGHQNSTSRAKGGPSSGGKIDPSNDGKLESVIGEKTGSSIGGKVESSIENNKVYALEDASANSKNTSLGVDVGLVQFPDVKKEDKVIKSSAGKCHHHHQVSASLTKNVFSRKEKMESSIGGKTIGEKIESSSKDEKVKSLKIDPSIVLGKIRAEKKAEIDRKASKINGWKERQSRKESFAKEKGYPETKSLFPTSKILNVLLGIYVVSICIGLTLSLISLISSSKTFSHLLELNYPTLQVLTSLLCLFITFQVWSSQSKASQKPRKFRGGYTSRFTPGFLGIVTSVLTDLQASFIISRGDGNCFFWSLLPFIYHGHLSGNQECTTLLGEIGRRKVNGRTTAAALRLVLMDRWDECIRIEDNETFTLARFGLIMTNENIPQALIQLAMDSQYDHLFTKYQMYDRDQLQGIDYRQNLFSTGEETPNRRPQDIDYNLASILAALAGFSLELIASGHDLNSFTPSLGGPMVAGIHFYEAHYNSMITATVDRSAIEAFESICREYENAFNSWAEKGADGEVPRGQYEPERLQVSSKALNKGAFYKGRFPPQAGQTASPPAPVKPLASSSRKQKKVDVSSSPSSSAALDSSPVTKARTTSSKSSSQSQSRPTQQASPANAQFSSPTSLGSSSNSMDVDEASTASVSRSEASPQAPRLIIPLAELRKRAEAVAQETRLEVERFGFKRKSLTPSLWEHQRETIKFMNDALSKEGLESYERLSGIKGLTLPSSPRETGGIINLGMGKGKTRTALWQIANNVEPGVDLVIVPTEAIKDQWMEEWKELVTSDEHYRLVPFSMLRPGRKETPGIIITIEEFKSAISKDQDSSHFQSLHRPFRTIFVDEAHHARNENQLFESIQKLKENLSRLTFQNIKFKPKIWLLTGTVLINGIDDAFALYELLGIEFERREIRNLQALNAAIWKFVCLLDTPSEATPIHYVGLSHPPEASEIYQRFRPKATKAGKLNASQIVTAECLANDLIVDRKQTQTLQHPIEYYPKIVFILNEILEIKAQRALDGLEPAQFLAFSTNPRLLNYAAAQGQFVGIASGVVVGGGNGKDRVEVINTFKKGVRKQQAHDIVLKDEIISSQRKTNSLSTPAKLPAGVVPEILFASSNLASEGLNLQMASKMFILNVGWSPSDQQQLAHRVDRPGQKEKVQVFSLYLKDTVEDSMMETLQRKDLEIKEAFTFIQKSHDDLLKLLRGGDLMDVDGESGTSDENSLNSHLDSVASESAVEEEEAEEEEEEETIDEVAEENLESRSTSTSTSTSTRCSSRDSMDLDRTSPSSSDATSVGSPVTHSSDTSNPSSVDVEMKDQPVVQELSGLTGESVDRWENILKRFQSEKEVMREMEEQAGVEGGSEDEDPVSDPSYWDALWEMEEDEDESDFGSEGQGQSSAPTYKRASPSAIQDLKANADSGVQAIFLNPTRNALDPEKYKQSDSKFSVEDVTEQFRKLHELAEAEAKGKGPLASRHELFNDFRNASKDISNLFREFGMEFQEQDIVEGFRMQNFSAAERETVAKAVKAKLLLVGTYALTGKNIGGMTLRQWILCHTFRIIRSFGRDLGDTICDSALFSDMIGLGGSMAEFEQLWPVLPTDMFFKMFKAGFIRNLNFNPEFMIFMGDKNKQALLETLEGQYKNCASMIDYFKGAHVFVLWDPKSGKPPCFIAFIDHLCGVDPLRRREEVVRELIKSLHHVGKCARHVIEGRFGQGFEAPGENDYKESQVYLEHFPPPGFEFGKQDSTFDPFKIIRAGELRDKTAKSLASYKGFLRTSLAHGLGVDVDDLEDYKPRCKPRVGDVWSHAFELLSLSSKHQQKCKLGFLANLEAVVKNFNSEDLEERRINQENVQWLRQRAFRNLKENKVPTHLIKDLKSALMSKIHGYSSDVFGRWKEHRDAEREIQKRNLGGTERKRKREGGDEVDEETVSNDQLGLYGKKAELSETNEDSRDGSVSMDLEEEETKAARRNRLARERRAAKNLAKRSKTNQDSRDNSASMDPEGQKAELSKTNEDSRDSSTLMDLDREEAELSDTNEDDLKKRHKESAEDWLKRIERRFGEEYMKHSGANTDEVRCCRKCQTTTPKGWRKGPDGLLSLCKRCGNKFRKRFEKVTGASPSTIPIPKIPKPTPIVGPGEKICDGLECDNVINRGNHFRGPNGAGTLCQPCYGRYNRWRRIPQTPFWTKTEHSNPSTTST